VNEADFDRIVHVCDGLLLGPSTSLERVAHPWLHVISPHPAITERYTPLAARWHAGAREPRGEWVRRVREIAASTRTLVRSAAGALTGTASSGTGLAADIAADGPRDVLIVSWLVRPDHLRFEDDFYFGDLQRLFLDQGLTSLLLLRNHTAQSTASLQMAARRHGPRARALLPDVLDPLAEARLWRRAARARQRLQAAAATLLDPRDRDVAAEAHARMAPVVLAEGLRLHEQLAAVITAVRPRILLTIYEGHAWERCVLNAARAADPRILRVGYQTTIVFERSHAMRRSLGADGAYDPDVILASGDVPRTTLERSPALRRTRVITLGSYRRPRTSVADRPRSSRTILVLPDGVATETILLFDFASRCARAMPDVRFILRAHPLLPFERVRSRLGVFSASLRNVEVSRSRSLDEDLVGAGAFIYRGSSTAVNGVLAGLRPFQFMRLGELDFDTLEHVGAWRERVADVDGFRAAIERDRAQDEATRTEQWLSARARCDAYFAPIDPTALTRLIEMATIGAE
jgi:hypothetical protein